MAGAAFSANPIFTDKWTADPAPLVDGDTLYLFTGHDDAREGELFHMEDWRVFSTRDLQNWTDHGAILRTDYTREGREENKSVPKVEWTKDASAWASQCVKSPHDGKYYFYFCAISKTDGMCVGVAVADKPTGPFKDAIGRPLVRDRDTPSPYWGNDIDPTVFIDADGTPWMAWGNPVPYLAKLKRNMVEIDGEIRFLSLPNYTEGPWLDKRGNTYYLIYPSRAHQGYGEHMDYATASCIEGPWIYRGRLTGGAERSYTIHPGLCRFRGRDIMFYHNATLEIDGVGGATGRRCVTADYVEISPNGPIKPFAQTKEGIALPWKGGGYDAKFGERAVPSAKVEGFTWKETSIAAKARNAAAPVSWPEGCAYASVKNPFMDSPECDGFNKDGGKSSMSERFTLGGDMRLSGICFYLTDGEGGEVVVSLKGADGKTLFEAPVEYVPQGLGLAALGIKGGKRPLLKAGMEYTLEVRAEKGNPVCFWRRGFKGEKPHGFALYEDSSSAASEPVPSGDGKGGGVTYRNPAIFADCPDVSLCCDGTYYYMVSTTMHMVPGAPVMRSKDMLHWDTIGYVFDRFDFAPEFSLEAPNGKTEYSGGQWASSFKYHKGKFYCYFVANRHGGFLYTADKAEGPWKLHCREPLMHDASLVFDDDGKVWVFHGDGWLTLMNDDLTGVAPGWKNVRLFDRSDETALLEGSAAFKKDGWYYLMMVSAFMPGHPRREVCYRSRNVTGPYEKKVILETEFDNHGGVGQGCVVEGPDGEWRALVFQDRGGVGRTPCLMPVRWVDDWPMLGDELGRIPNDETKPYPDLSGIAGSDGFDSPKLDLRWQWNHNPLDSAWSLKERPGWMRLRANVAQNLFLARNTLTQRMLGPVCDGGVKMDVSKMKDGDRAGFAAFQGDSAVAEIAMENGRKTISLSRQTVKFRNNNGRFFDSLDREDHAKEELKGDVVWLRVRGDFRNGQDWAEVAWSDDGKAWHWSGKHVPMRFDIGKFFMGARFAIFNYATKQTGGHVDVDKFVLRTEGHEPPTGAAASRRPTRNR